MAEEKIAPGTIGTEAKGIRYNPPNRDNRGIQNPARRSFLGVVGKTVLGAVGIAVGGATVAEVIKRTDQPTPTEQEGQKLGAANQAMREAEQNKAAGLQNAVSQEQKAVDQLNQTTGQNNVPPALK